MKSQWRFGKNLESLTIGSIDSVKKITGGGQLEKLVHAGRIPKCFMILAKWNTVRCADQVKIAVSTLKFGTTFLCNLTALKRESMSRWPKKTLTPAWE